MCFFTSLTVLGLVASRAIASEASSAYEVVQSYPTCARECMAYFFSDVLGDACGLNAYNSTDTKDIKCICGSDKAWSESGDALGTMYTCIKDTCANATGDDAQELLNDDSEYKDLDDWCKEYNSGASPLASYMPIAVGTAGLVSMLLL